MGLIGPQDPRQCKHVFSWRTFLSGRALTGMILPRKQVTVDSTAMVRNLDVPHLSILPDCGRAPLYVSEEKLLVICRGPTLLVWPELDLCCKAPLDRGFVLIKRAGLAAHKLV